MNIELFYNIGIYCLLIGIVLNALECKEGFLFWIVSNSIFLYRGLMLNDTFWIQIYIISLASSILGYIIWKFELKLERHIKDWIRL